MTSDDEADGKIHVESPASSVGRDYAERSLQTYLARNLSILGIPDAILVASEYQTEVGRIDLLIGSQNSTLWVVELKAGVAGRDAIGQIVSYIGAMRNEQPGKRVFGILIATDFDRSCLAAHSAVGDIALKRVRIEYALDDVLPKNATRGVESERRDNQARLKGHPSDPEKGIACCWRCESEREVSNGSQGFHCRACNAFNVL